MLTPDKDYGQLVTDRVFIYRPRHGGGYEVMGTEEVKAKYAIPSTHAVIDLLALMGDSADNFPGCPGVGEKTAAKLIGEFGSIEGLLARTSEIKGKLREKVEGAVDDIIMSRKLATIRTDVPMTIDLDAMKVHEPDLDRLKQLFDELEFKTFADKLLGTSNTQSQQKTAKTKKSSKKQTDVNFQPSFFEEFEAEGTGSFKFSTREDESEPVSNIQTLENVEDALQFLHKISTYEKINSSVEGDQKSGIDGKMTGIALGADEETTAYIPLPPTLPQRDVIITNLAALFDDDSKTWVMENAKYALQLLWHEGITVKGRLWDTMVAHYLINPDLHRNKEYMERPFSRDIVAELPKQKEQYEAALKAAGMLTLFEQVEMPLVPVLAEMELNGVLIDTQELQRVNDELSARLANIEHEIYELADETFNIASPKQVADILYVKLKITDKTKKTKTKQLSTAEE